MGEKVYLYDGSFEGLLTAVALAVKAKEPVAGIWKKNIYVPGLFDSIAEIENDSAQAQRLADFLRQISPQAVQLAVQAWLSEDENAGNLLQDFVRLCLARGSGAISLYSNDTVRTLHELSKKVSFEAHRLNGMLRFRIMADDLQYGPFRSDHNVIGLCAMHFQHRFGERRWILHDLGRRFALYCDGSRLQAVDIDEELSLFVDREGELPAAELTFDEQYYQKLWRGFHETISIPDRENRLLQRSFMPRRYWHFMVELKK